MSDADTLSLPIVGRVLSQVSVGIGYYLILKFWGQPDYEIAIEGESSVSPGDGAPIAQLTSRSSRFDPVIELLGVAVATATASGRGALLINFANGGSFSVEAPNGFETWQLRDEDNTYVVVTHAGGGIVECGERPT